MTIIRSPSVCVPSHASTAAQAARPNMIVQAGPNSQSGGCQLGFLRFLYQAPISVSSPPAPPRMTAQAIAAMTGVLNMGQHMGLRGRQDNAIGSQRASI